MLRHKEVIHKALILTGALCMLLVTGGPQALAAAPPPFNQRSVSLGSYEPGAVNTYEFSLNFSPSTSVGAIVFEICDSPLQMVACVKPAGFDASQAQLTYQSGATGFGLDSATPSKLIMSRAPTVNASGFAVYRFDDITNPTTAGTFYIRISTYDGQDESGALTAFGAVAASINTGNISITTEVPPYLEFCVGVTIPTNCDSAQGYIVNLGTLTPARAVSGTSQMLVATNGAFGMAITSQGSTMASGNNVIPALSHPTSSAPGVSQFGINLRANTDPHVGNNMAGDGAAVPAASYNQPNAYMFRNQDVLATSGGSIDFHKFTVSYVANVATSQPPGIYNTTLTYICTATF